MGNSRNKKNFRKESMGRRAKRALMSWVELLVLLTVSGTVVFAAGDTITIIKNIYVYLSAPLYVAGICLVAFGAIQQINLSLKTHKPRQRVKSLLIIAVGIMIIIAEKIVTRMIR